jgi:hypothetical protein
MDASAIPKLTLDTLQVLRDIFVGLMTIWEQRGLRKPVAHLVELFFVPGGMRQTLQRVADGQGNDHDIATLKEQLGNTEPGVSSIIKTLTDGWDRLIRLPDGLSVANEIGNLIHSPIGKMGIRHAIGEVTEGEPRNPTTIARAKQLCSDIDRFNERIIELHTRVLKPAAEIFQARNK